MLTVFFSQNISLKFLIIIFLTSVVYCIVFYCCSRCPALYYYCIQQQQLCAWYTCIRTAITKIPYTTSRLYYG